MKLIDVIHSATDLLWPPRCIACGQKSDPLSNDLYSAAFCHNCSQSILPVQTPKCPRCAVPFDSGHTDHICGHCLKNPPSFVEAYSLFEYGAAVARAISRFKYEPAPWIRYPLGDLMISAIPELARPDFVVPVPLHPKRLRQRGFNQSSLLAKPVASKLKVPLVTGALIRVSNSPPQAGKSRAERIKSMSGAFKARSRSKLPGSRVLLVDDVVTTTATVEAASAALLGAGCEQVAVLSLARAV